MRKPPTHARGACIAASLCALASVTACEASARQQQSDATGADTLHIRVLATHDLHGALMPQTFPWSAGHPVGGLAVLKAAMDSAASRCRCVTFRLDGGDQMQGTLESNLTNGAAVVQAFNLLGLDGAAIGNHELDWGVATFEERRAEAHYPWLAANVYEKVSGRRPPWALPYAIVEHDNVRVGLVGYLTANTVTALRASIGAPFEFRSGLAAIADALDAVRAEAPDFIVIVAHAGGDCDARACRGEMVELASRLDSAGVDLIVGGHVHTSGTGVVNGIPIVRAGSSGRALAIVDLYRTHSGEKRFTIATDTMFVDRYGNDRTIAAALQPYLEVADSLATRPVASLREPMRAAGRGLGNLIADAVRLAGAADVGLHNPGGTRSDLPAGTITYSQVFRVLPFDNTVHRLSLTGALLRDVVEHGVAGSRPFFFSGIRVRYDPRSPAGHRVVSIELANGTPIDAGATYTLATADFLAEGGDGFNMLADLTPEPVAETLLEAAIHYLQSLPVPISAPSDIRVSAVR